MLRLDFVSDISCPWCAIGLAHLKNAIATLGDEIDIELHIQPFELNPNMNAEGANLVEYLVNKYGMTKAQVDGIHATLRERGQEAGFLFGKREHIWNTFNAHRLIYWAGNQVSLAKQLQLKTAVVQAYQGEGKNPNDTNVLLTAVAHAGLDINRAKHILNSDDYVKEVREAETFWQKAGINSVPSLIINQQHLLQGAQPAENILQALKQIAAQSTT